LGVFSELKTDIMKTILLLIVLIVPGLSLFSQDNFKVIKVNGTIVIRAKGISLETGTVFAENEDLLFRSEDATAAVINSQKGRMILTNANHDLKTAKSNFLPSMYNISTRGGSLSNLIDLQNHFSGKYVILDRLAITMDGSNFPMDNSHFFFIRYLYKNEKINKKLSYSGDTLFIDKKSLYTVDGNQIPAPDNNAVSLYYMNGSDIVLINSFNLIFPDMDQLKKEVKVIADEMKGKTFKEKFNETNSYINDMYGKVYQASLIEWLRNSIGLKQE
jgi:hypothetical protein